MIPTTTAELELLNQPGDVIRRAELEPFRFEWAAGTLHVDIPGSVILSVSVDSSDNVKVVFTESPTTFKVWTVGSHTGTYAGAPGYSWVQDVDGFRYSVNNTSVREYNTEFYAPAHRIESFCAVAYRDFYYHYTTDEGVHRLVHYHDGSAVESDIYWVGQIRTLQAVRLVDHDVVIVCGDMPQYVTAEVNNGELAWSPQDSEGIVAFVVKNDVWSDHYTVEGNERDTQKFERTTAFKTPNDKIGVAYLASLDGVPNVFVTLSADGRAWTLPIPLSKPGTGHTPFIATTNSTIYAINQDGLYSSPIFRLFGGTPVALDITDDVLTCSLSQEQRSGVNMVLRRTDELVTYMRKGGFLLLLYAGYHYPDDDVEKLIFTGEADNLNIREDNIPNPVIAVPFRDVSSWLDRSKSPLTIEADGITTALDDYADSTGTGFGGMSRTAAFRGSFKTEDGVLAAVSDGECAAFSTAGNFVNGEVSVFAELDDIPNDAVGVAYRAIGDTLLMRLIYRAATTSLALERVNKDTITTLDSATINLGVTPKLRAAYRYGRHTCYYSTDGVEWTEALSALYAEHCYFGSAGVVGNQYVPGYIPDPWEPPAWEPPFWPPPIPEPAPSVWPTVVYVATVTGGVYKTTTFSGRDSAAQPVWYTVNNGLPDDGGDYHITRFWLDPFDTTYQYCHVLGGGTDSIWRRNDTANLWTEILTPAQAQATSGLTGYAQMIFGVNATVDGKIAAVVRAGNVTPLTTRKQRLITSEDRGETWSVASADTVGNGWQESFYPLYIRGDSIAFRNGPNPYVYRSPDGGASWAQSTGGTGIGETVGEVLNVYDDTMGTIYIQIALNAGTSGKDIGIANFAGNPHEVVSVPGVAEELYGHVTNYGGFGGMWVSQTDPTFQWVLRRKESSNTSQELWQTTDAWVTATKIADLTVAASGENLYRRALLRLSDDPELNHAILGYRAPTRFSPDPDQPHSVFAFDLDYAATPLGKSGAMPKVSPYTDSIPYTKGGAIDDGVAYVPLSGAL